MDVRNQCVGARNIALDLGNDGAGYDVVMDVRTGSVRAFR